MTISQHVYIIFWGVTAMDIRISGVSKQFDKKEVLSDITFTIPSGSIVCLLGPSGSGKTTLIRLMVGAIAAERGEISFNDVTVPNLALMRKTGFMPQNDALYIDLPGEDNLRFFAGLHGMKKSEIDARVNAVLKLVDLEADRRKYVALYSGGMKKRLSLAAALVHEPEVLLLDEPTVGIDPVLRRTIWQQFGELKKAGKTLIVTTHVMDEVDQCDKAALIYNGKLIRYDTVAALSAETKSGKVEELFFTAADKEKGAASK
jgi:ABC-2 type transport system ATP-binding protein